MMHFEFLNINHKSPRPIYRQLIDSMENALRNGMLHKGDLLPSVNQVAQAFNVSRDTVLQAYAELKTRGLVVSHPGKGYYVERTRVEARHRILLLFDELNAFKEDLYNGFVEHLENADVELYFHHFNADLFQTILFNHKDDYTSYVIMPAVVKNVASFISALPQDKVFILDQLPASLCGLYPAVYQSFEEDIFNGFQQGLSLLQKYEGMVLVYPGGKEPEGFLSGFKKFCAKYSIYSDIIPSMRSVIPRKGWVYILVNDRDLVFLIKYCRANNLKPGLDIGIISLNDTGLKEIVAGGITTISTDFQAMGERMARMVMNNQHDVVKNPSRLILRNSL